jgi:chitodextrinase
MKPILSGDFIATPKNYWSVALSWKPSTDQGGSGLKEYQIFRNQVWIKTVAPNEVSFIDDNKMKKLDSNTTYLYQIQAIDGAGNKSDALNATVKTPAIQRSEAATLVVNNCNGCHTKPGIPPLPRNWTSQALIEKFSKSSSMKFLNDTLTTDEINSISYYLSDESDKTLPTTPVLSSTGNTFSSVTLSWTASSDSESGVNNYIILRGTSTLNDKTPNNATSFTDTTASEKTTYKYTIIAVDKAGNQSLPSNEVSVTTPAKPQAPDTQAPTVPVLTATAKSYKLIHLSWTASTDTGGSGIQKYVLTRTTGTSSTVDFTKDLTATSFDDSSVISNTKYSYQIRAVDGAGNKSALSAAAIATTQDLNVGSVFIGTSPTNPGKCTGCHGHHSTEQALIEKFQSASPQITNANLLKQLGDRYSDMKDTFNGLSAEELNSIFNYLSAAPKPPTPLQPGPVVQSKIMTFNAPEPTANNMFWRIYQIFQQAPTYQDSKGITHYVLHDRTIYKPGVLGGGCSRYDFCSISNSSVPSPSWNLVRAGLILNGCSELISHKDFSVSKVLSTAGIVGAAVPTPDSNNIKTVYSHFFPGYSPSEAVVNSLLSISTETGTDKTEAWKNIFLPLCEWSAGGTQ